MNRVNDSAVREGLALGPVSPAAESVDSSLGIIDSFGEEVPAVELLVALIVAAHRGKVRPGGRSGVIGRSGKFVGHVEGLVCVGETGVGDGQLGAGMTSTEDARVVEVALSEASGVLGLCDELRPLHRRRRRTADTSRWLL